MKQSTQRTAITLALFFFSFACKKEDDTTSNTTTVTDVDGNVYATVQIGTQVWMKENLKAAHYRNGDIINNVTDNTAWASLSTGAWCYFNNSTSNAGVGKLYNWYAVNDSRNIAPSGWHVATNADWVVLETYLGDAATAGGKLKETGTTHWLSPNTGATNSVGFNAIAAEFRSNVDGSFAPLGLGYNAYWWTSTQQDATTAWFRNLNYNLSTVYSFYVHKATGASVRCVKD